MNKAENADGVYLFQKTLIFDIVKNKKVTFKVPVAWEGVKAYDDDNWKSDFLASYLKQHLYFNNPQAELTLHLGAGSVWSTVMPHQLTMEVEGVLLQDLENVFGQIEFCLFLQKCQLSWRMMSGRPKTLKFGPIDDVYCGIQEFNSTAPSISWTTGMPWAWSTVWNDKNLPTEGFTFQADVNLYMATKDNPVV